MIDGAGRYCAQIIGESRPASSLKGHNNKPMGCTMQALL